MKNLRFCLAALAFFPIISQGNEAPEASVYPAGFVFVEELQGSDQHEAQPDGWQALPRGRAFPVLPSDPRDLKLGLRKNNKDELEADVGGYRSLAGWKGDWWGESAIFHTGIEGNGYFQMRQQGSKFPLQSSDGLVGVYGEAARGLWMYQLRFTHISAHLSDGLFGQRSAFVYTREFIALRAARQVGYFRPYVGYQVLTHVSPTVPRHSLQIGAYGILPMHWGIAHPYVGGDLRIRNAQEGTTFQLGAGAAFVSKSGMPPVRVVVTYLKGHDLRGQFYEERTEKWTLGLELDI